MLFFLSSPQSERVQINEVTLEQQKSKSQIENIIDVLITPYQSLSIQTTDLVCLFIHDHSLGQQIKQAHTLESHLLP